MNYLSNLVQRFTRDLRKKDCAYGPTHLYLFGNVLTSYSRQRFLLVALKDIGRCCVNLNGKEGTGYYRHTPQPFKESSLETPKIFRVCSRCETLLRF